LGGIEQTVNGQVADKQLDRQTDREIIDKKAELIDENGQQIDRQTDKIQNS
jgi:hypothetical protein